MNRSKDQAQERIDELMQAVARRDVCYEVWPEYAIHGERVMVGFSLELYGTGTHDHALTPGCKYCIETYHDLHRIAEWIRTPIPV